MTSKTKEHVKKKLSLPRNHRGPGRIRPEAPKPEPNPVGRPSTYTKDIAVAICEDIATSSRSLDTICSQNSEYPTPRTVYRWLRDNEQFRQLYQIARQDQLHVLAEEIAVIADTPQEGREVTIVRDAQGKNVVKEIKTKEMLGHRELRIKVRQWLLAKLDPQKYGERVQIDDRRDTLADVLAEFRKANQSDLAAQQQKYPDAPDPDQPVPSQSQVPTVEPEPVPGPLPSVAETEKA